jgi:hypothetical protein
MLDVMQQSALLGEGVGDAVLGDFPHLYFAASTGTVFAGGIAKVIDAVPTPFQVLNVGGILQSALSGMGGKTATDLYTLSRSFFIYPNARISFGVGTAGGVEVTGQVSYWPQLFTDGVGGLAGLTGLTLNHLNAGLRVRAALLADSGAFPAVSIGAGYVFSSFGLGYNLSSLPAMNVSGVDLDFSQASFALQTYLHSAGIDLTVSKRLLVFVPFFRVSSWYQWGFYDASLSHFRATLGNTVDVSPASHLTAMDLAILLSGGIGLKLGGFGLTIGASYNPKTNQPAAELSLSGQG